MENLIKCLKRRIFIYTPKEISLSLSTKLISRKERVIAFLIPLIHDIISYEWILIGAAQVQQDGHGQNSMMEGDIENSNPNQKSGKH